MPDKDASTYAWLVERRHFPLIVVVIFVLLSVTTFYICYRHYTINTERALKDDRSTANLVSLALAEHLKKIVSVMESYSNRPLLLKAVRDKNVEKARKHLVNLTKSNPDIDSLIITDRQGTLWAAYPDRPEVMEKSFAHRDWYKGVSKEWKSNISDVVQRAVAEKDLSIQIGVPFFDETGEVIGILLNTQRTLSFSNLIKQVLPDPGTAITVTDRKGQIVYSSQHDFEKEILLFPFYPSIRKATVANKKTVTVDAPDVEGGAQFMSFSPLVNVGWTVFVGRDKHSIILSESTYFIQVTAIALLLFLSSILFMVYLRKQVVAQQITEQLQTEKELRARDQRYKSYIDVTMQLGWTTDDKGEIVEDNPSWRKYTGRSYEEFKGFRWIEDIHPDDRDHTDKIWKKAVAEKSFYETEYRIRRYDGVYRDYLARGTPLLDENGSIREWVGTCIDITERKQAGEALKKSEEKFVKTFRSNPACVGLSRLRDGLIIEANEAMLRILGYSNDEFVGHTIPELGVWNDLADRERVVQTLLTEGRSINREYWLRTRTGELTLCSHSAEMIQIDNEPYIIFTFFDLTERKRAEEALINSEKKYRNIFENATEGIFQSTTEGRYISVNPAFARIGGYNSPDEMTDTVTDIQKEMYVHQDDRTRLLELLNKQDIITNFEAEIRRRDNAIIWISMNVRTIRDEGGKVIFLEGTIVDITERKRIEQALRESEEQFRNLFDNAVEGVFQSTPEGRLIRVNMAFSRMFGCESPEEAIKTVTDIGHQMYVNPDDRKRAIGIFRETGFIKNFESRMLRKDGSIFWASFNGRLTKTSDGTPCLEGFITDISDRKEAEEEIKKLNAELEQRVIERTVQLTAANRELEAFSYSVSHDLRAPLRSIDGFSQALLEEYQEKPLDETGKTYLERVRKATQRMGFLIDDMLKLSRVTQSEFKRESVVLSCMVRAIAETHQKYNPDRDVDVTVQDGIMVQGDPLLMQIALENLMDNAWKFTGKEAHPRIEFATTVRDGKTACFIRDNGAGFDMAYVGKLFGAFQRLHTVDEFPGTGIGLATVQRIIHRHGGQVWAEGEVGKGATFYFMVPS